MKKIALLLSLLALFSVSNAAQYAIYGDDYNQIASLELADCPDKVFWVLGRADSALVPCFIVNVYKDSVFFPNWICGNVLPQTEFFVGFACTLQSRFTQGGAAVINTANVLRDSGYAYKLDDSVTIVLQTSPLMKQIYLDGVLYTAPLITKVATGSTHILSTDSIQSGYKFVGWSDFLEITHSITPYINTTYTCYFELVSGVQEQYKSATPILSDPKAYYDLLGRKIQKPTKNGIYLVRYSNGRTKKMVIIK
jgi:hypothetical protein